MARGDKHPPEIDEEWLRELVELRSWFEYALGKDEFRKLQLSPKSCEKLTRNIQVVANRWHNAQLAQQHHPDPVPPRLLKDVDPTEELGKRLRQFGDDVRQFHAAAGRLLRSSLQLEEYAGSGDHWDGVSLADLQNILARISADPVLMRIGATTSLGGSPAPGPGRPREPSHELMRQIARLIKDTLREAGYRGDLTPTHPNSAIAIVGAKVVSRIHEITPEGFATAMRDRDRSKNKKNKEEGVGSFEERYPGVKPTRNLPDDPSERH